MIKCKVKNIYERKLIKKMQKLPIPFACDSQNSFTKFQLDYFKLLDIL